MILAIAQTVVAVGGLVGAAVCAIYLPGVKR